MMKRIVFTLIICFWVGRVLAIDHRIPAVQDSVRLDTVKKSLQAQSLQHLLERDSLPLMTLPIRRNGRKNFIKWSSSIPAAAI